jgi:hypothetical protein
MPGKSAAIGFSPHSGWAAMIALAEESAGPQVLARSRIELIDADDPQSKQPYHAVEFLCIEAATGRIDGYLHTAIGLAQRAIQAQVTALKERGYHVTCVGILESASRKQTALASILASHAMIHAADGDLFRNALAAAAQRLGLRVSRIPVRALEAHALERLRPPLQPLLDSLNNLGRPLGPPWGADQKKAALLAWTLLKNPAA